MDAGNDRGQSESVREKPTGRRTALGGSSWVQHQGLPARPVASVTAFTLVASAMWAWAFEQGGRPADDSRFILWGTLVIGLGLTSGAAFEFGLRRRVSVNDVQPVAWRPVVLLTIGVSSVAAALTCANFAIEPSWGTAAGSP